MSGTSVSVIVPVFNDQENLENVLSDLRNQTYRDFLVYFIDDGSTDKSASLIKRATLRDKRFFLFSLKENSGQAKARKYGLNKVVTPFVTFLDADDRVNSQWLEKMVEPLFRGTDISVIGYDMVITGLNPKVRNGPIDRSEVLHGHDQIMTEWLLDKQLQGFLWNKMFRTKILRKSTNEFTFNWLEDVAWINSIISHVECVTINNSIQYHYVQASGSSMHRRLNANDRQSYLVLSRQFKQFSLKGSGKIKDLVDFRLVETGLMFFAQISFRDVFRVKKEKEVFLGAVRSLIEKPKSLHRFSAVTIIFLKIIATTNLVVSMTRLRLRLLRIRDAIRY